MGVAAEFTSEKYECEVVKRNLFNQPADVKRRSFSCSLQISSSDNQKAKLGSSPLAEPRSSIIGHSQLKFISFRVFASSRSPEPIFTPFLFESESGKLIFTFEGLAMGKNSQLWMMDRCRTLTLQFLSHLNMPSALISQSSKLKTKVELLFAPIDGMRNLFNLGIRYHRPARMQQGIVTQDPKAGNHEASQENSEELNEEESWHVVKRKKVEERNNTNEYHETQSTEQNTKVQQKEQNIQESNGQDEVMEISDTQAECERRTSDHKYCFGPYQGQN
ncbi:hypothetical protein RND71_005496 [Anisodus tanguticus]|uniref:Uncharacterized protein n=1 Tax=Anisodus tanguticus TaxID=243964 RepID=A0AAE1SQ57_9SOLA|nr:hypothetical protein RND71_005496 [Anisodus tanguticus]